MYVFFLEHTIVAFCLQGPPLTVVVTLKCNFLHVYINSPIPSRKCRFPTLSFLKFLQDKRIQGNPPKNSAILRSEMQQQQHYPSSMQPTGALMEKQSSPNTPQEGQYVLQHGNFPPQGPNGAMYHNGMMANYPDPCANGHSYKKEVCTCFLKPFS